MEYRNNAAPLAPDRSVLVVGLRGLVYGLDRVTGAVRWRNSLPEGGLGEVFIAVGFGVVVASARGANLHCLSYLTGETRWVQPTQAMGRATIVIEAAQIVCAKGGYIDCFAPDGTTMWSQPLKGAGLGRMALGFPGNVAQADDVGSQ
jgi:outer membrane protein assembly factor BamB